MRETERQREQIIFFLMPRGTQSSANCPPGVEKGNDCIFPSLSALVVTSVAHAGAAAITTAYSKHTAFMNKISKCK